MESITSIGKDFYPKDFLIDSVKKKAEGLSLHPTADNVDKKLMEVSRDFESLLLNQMLSVMRKSVMKSGLLDSFAEDTFQEMMDQNLAKEMSKSKGIGIADMVFQELNRKHQATKIQRSE